MNEKEVYEKTIAEQQKEIHILQLRVKTLKETLDDICKFFTKVGDDNGNSSS